MGPLDLALAAVVDRHNASQNERDIADWHTCDAVLRNLQDFGPTPAPQPEVDGEAMRTSMLRNLLRKPPADGQRELLMADPVSAKDFADYRVRLTDHEALESRKLYRLAFAVQTLMRIRSRAVDTQHVDRALGVLGDWVARAWRTDVPLQADVRVWSSRMTRNYELMSREWREL